MQEPSTQHESLKARRAARIECRAIIERKLAQHAPPRHAPHDQRSDQCIRRYGLAVYLMED